MGSHDTECSVVPEVVQEACPGHLALLGLRHCNLLLILGDAAFVPLPLHLVNQNEENDLMACHVLS